MRLTLLNSMKKVSTQLLRRNLPLTRTAPFSSQSKNSKNLE